MESLYTVDEIIALLAKCISDEIMSQAVCNSLINVTQTAAINCSEDDLTALRNSDACIDAVLSNDPNQTRICNSCYIVDSSQTVVVNAQLQCGSNAFNHVRGSFTDKLTTFKPRAKLDGMTLSAINAIATLVTEHIIVPTVKQGILVGQNLTNVASGSNQTVIVDTIMRSFIDLPELHARIIDLLKLLNDFGVTIPPPPTPPPMAELPPPITLIVETKPVVNNTQTTQTDTKKTSNVYYAVIAILVAILLLAIIIKRKKVTDGVSMMRGVRGGRTAPLIIIR